MTTPLLMVPPPSWLPSQTVLLGVALAAVVALFVMRRRYARRLASVEAELAKSLEQQRVLLQRDAGLRTILDHTNTIFFILDRDSTVLLSEGMGLNLVKRPSGGTVGMKFLEAHPDRTDLQEYFDRSMRGETVQALVSFSGGTFQLLTSPLPDAAGGLAGILLDVSELVQARARVTESEAMIRSLFDNAPYSMVVQRVSDGIYLEANQVFLRNMGISREQLHAFDVRNIVDLGQEEAQALRWRIAEQGGLHGQEASVPRPGGGMAQVLYSTVPITYAGQPCLLSMTVDITAQNEATRARMESEERLSAIFNNAPLGVFLSTVDGRIEEVNPELVRMLGYDSRDELLSVDPRAVYAQAGVRDEVLRELLASPAGVRRELVLRRKDGQPLPAVLCASLAFDAEGRPVRVHGVLEDLTRRKEQERELQFWSQRFEIVNTAAQHIFYDYNLRTGDMQWIGAVREVLGFERQELDGPIQIWEGLLHPDDAQEVLPRLATACESGAKFDMDYRLRHKDGYYVYVHDSGIFKPGEDGRPAQMLGIIQDISARKQAELALSAREEMYRTLFASAQDTILIMDGPIIVDCNSSASVLTGYAREDMIGRTPADFSPPVQANGEATTRMMQRMLEQAETGRGLRFEWLCQRKDGGIAEVETSLTPMQVGGARYLLALTRDVTDRKETERNLRLSEEKFSKIYDMAPYSTSIARLRDSIILDVNAAFESLTGYSRAEAVNQNGDSLRLWNDPERRQVFLEQLRRDGTVLDFEFVLRRKDGALRTALNSCQGIEINGELCTLNIVRDITEITLVQQTMVQTEKMMSLGGLAAGMAHEINNPLGIIVQSVQGMQRRFDPGLAANRAEAEALEIDLEAVQEYMSRRNILRYLDGVMEACTRATDIVRNMLNFSRKSDSGIIDQDVAALVRQAISLAEKDYDLKKKFDFRQIDVRLELSEELPSLPCIPAELSQVLLNLLRNAAHAMSEGGTHAPAITVRASRQGDEARIEVEDNGPGIPAEQLKRVFEPFYTTKKVGEGTGLGLSVSYFIITTTHRGKISVDSTLGRGTRFTILLPLTRAARSAAG